MEAALLGQALTLLIMLWGLWIMISPIIPKTGFGRRTPVYSSGEGCLGNLMGVLLKSILLPVVWWSISIGAMLYHRGLVVSTEFLSGVHDWPTYRTSSYKFLGAIFGFLGYNGVLFSFVFLVAVLNLSGNIQNQTEIEQLWLLTAGLFAASILSYLFARFFLRRMP